jgi:hypothetical protein
LPQILISDANLDLPNDSILKYPANLDLLKITDLLDELKLDDLEFGASEFGSLLRELSKNFNKTSPSIIRHSFINNTTVDKTSFILLTGVIPMESKVFIMKSIQSRLTAFKNARQFFNGELEVMAYSYWHLSTTDLVDWPIDNISKTKKHILEHVCQYSSYAKCCRLLGSWVAKSRIQTF